MICRACKISNIVIFLATPVLSVLRHRKALPQGRFVGALLCLGAACNKNIMCGIAIQRNCLAAATHKTSYCGGRDDSDGWCRSHHVPVEKEGHI